MAYLEACLSDVIQETQIYPFQSDWRDTHFCLSMAFLRPDK